MCPGLPLVGFRGSVASGSHSVTPVPALYISTHSLPPNREQGKRITKGLTKGCVWGGRGICTLGVGGKGQVWLMGVYRPGGDCVYTCL